MNIELIITYGIPLIAVLIAIVSLYHSYFKGPEFRFEHISRNLQGTGVGRTYRHIIAVVNNGNKVGLIRDINLKTKNVKEITNLRVSIDKGKEKRIDLTEKKKIFSVGPKESVILFCDCDFSFDDKKIPDYCIEISYDKQILLDICKREWKSDSYKD